MAISRPVRRQGRSKAKKLNTVDVLVGSRVRLRRGMLGLSEEKLGAAIGVTFQQVQKYERGANRIGASRLHELSRILDVPISFFFDDTDPARAPADVADQAEVIEGDPLRQPETVELVEAHWAIERNETRGRRRNFVKPVASPARPPRRKG